MEIKFKVKLTSFFKTSINTILKTKGISKVKTFFSTVNQVPLKKTNIFFLFNSVLFLSFFKKSNKFLFSANQSESQEIPLEDRMNVIQYNANTPIEDRFNAIKLKNIKGNLLAVYDGHGGDHTSNFVSEKMAPYLDSIFLELTKMPKNKDKTIDELITQALFDTFHKIVKFNIKIFLGI